MTREEKLQALAAFESSSRAGGGSILQAIANAIANAIDESVHDGFDFFTFADIMANAKKILKTQGRPIRESYLRWKIRQQTWEKESGITRLINPVAKRDSIIRGKFDILPEVITARKKTSSQKK